MAVLVLVTKTVEIGASDQLNKISLVKWNGSAHKIRKDFWMPWLPKYLCRLQSLTQLKVSFLVKCLLRKNSPSSLVPTWQRTNFYQSSQRWAERQPDILCLKNYHSFIGRPMPHFLDILATRFCNACMVLLGILDYPRLFLVLSLTQYKILKYS